MYLLDTDTISNLLDENRGYEGLRRSVLSVPPRQRFICIVNVEEILQGQWAAINSARGGKAPPERVVQEYALFRRLFDDLQKFQVLDYCEKSEQWFRSLDHPTQRNYGLDCRIAAVAAANDLVVVTGNTRHYEKIALAKCVDWMGG